MATQSQLQSAGVAKRTLKEIVAEQYKMCATDPVYFMRKYCIIQHPQRGKIPFNLYDFQEKVLNSFQVHDYNIVLKSRQLGLSTLVAGYALWLMLFHNDKNILVIATKQGVAKNLVTKVRIMHDNLPVWLKGNCTEDNKLSLAFSNGSMIKAETSAPEKSGRSEALSLLVLDEAAFIDDIDTIWAAASMTLATGGNAIILSTPNGVGNFFHKKWVEAESGTDASGFFFNPIQLHWTVHPERDKNWRAKQDLLLGPRLASQECDCDFITSGNTVVDGLTLQWYNDTPEMVSDPLEKQGIDRNTWVWKYPDYTKTYIISADVARGDGSDYSACQVFDVETMEQVAEYKGLIGTKDYGNFLVNLATQYNDALLVVENSNMGWAVIQQIIERKYKNLFYSSPDMVRVDVESQIKRNWDFRDQNNSTKLVAGITMLPLIRGLVVSKIDEYFRSKEIKVHSKRLIGELFTWIWKNGRADHLDGYNDDTVMSAGIALLVRDTALRLKQRGIELTKRTLEHMKSTQGVYTPTQRLTYNPWELQVRGMSENLEWLIDQRGRQSGSAEVHEVVEQPPMPIVRG